MATYATLRELVQNEDPLNVKATLDNDNVSFWLKGDPEQADLLALHPYEVQEQALDLLGIDTEPA